MNETAPSLRALARALGVVHSAVQAARNAGRIDLSGGPPYDVEAIRAQWAANTGHQGSPLAARPLASGVATPAEAESYSEARARKESAAATLKELELKARKRELVSAAGAALALEDLALKIRGKVLALAAQCKARDPGFTVGQVATIEAVAHEALEDLSRSGHHAEALARRFGLTEAQAAALSLEVAQLVRQAVTELDTRIVEAATRSGGNPT